MPSRDDDAVFVAERSRLLGIAYRVLGSWHEAEDVVSEVWLRWHRHREEVDAPAAWLTRVTSRVALDVLRSARVRRESYAGPWLPEPHVRDVAAPPDPLDLVLADESVRLAFVAALELLTPEQRVALVLHDALALPFTEVAELLDVSEAAARQHAARARRRIRDLRPPARPAAAEAQKVVEALAAALAAGDAAEVARLLAPDVTLVADGGGEVLAARRPLHGSEVGRFLAALARRYAAGAHVAPVLVNGDPGLLIRLTDPPPRMPPVAVYAFTVHEGKVAGIHAVVAPEKLSRLRDVGQPPGGTPHRH